MAMNSPWNARLSQQNVPVPGEKAETERLVVGVPEHEREANAAMLDVHFQNPKSRMPSDVTAYSSRTT